MQKTDCRAEGYRIEKPEGPNNQLVLLLPLVQKSSKVSKKQIMLGEHPSGEGPHGELKWRVRALSSDFPSIGTGCVYRNLSAFGAGTDYYQRIGRRVFIHYIDVYGTLVGGQTNSVADDPYNTVKVALVLATPAFTPSTEWSVTTPLGPQQVPGLIKTLWTTSFVINTNAKDSTGYIAKGISIGKRIPVNLKFEYTTTTDVAASNLGLFLVCTSDSVAVTNPGFNSGYSLVCFSDA